MPQISLSMSSFSVLTTLAYSSVPEPRIRLIRASAIAVSALPDSSPA